MEYLQDNWLSLLSLIIALLGGIPGVLAAISHFKDKPKFHFNPATIITGELPNERTNMLDSMLLISGTASNDGPQPLSPDRFELSIDIDSQWRAFKPILIPENAQFLSQVQEINFREPWKQDLQRFSGAIPKGRPIYGFLMFVHESIDVEQIRGSIDQNRLLKITCIDIYGRKHEKELKANASAISEDAIYPKHGVSVKTKPNN